MRFTDALADAPLSVGLDIRHPLAYLALRPAIEFGRELGLQINWVPITGQPLKAPSIPRPDDDRSVRHKRHRANMIAREIALYAEAQGLTVQEPYRDGSPVAAHLAWLWMRAAQPDSLEPFLEDLFRRYWSLELDAASLDDVASVIEAFGENPGAFRAWAGTEGPTVAAELADALTESGMSQVPAYLVGDELFWGRQHLPMIRWILEGRNGPGPI